MPITKEILSLFEFSQNKKKKNFSVDNHFDEWPPSQQRSVPTEGLTLSMHQYLLVESHHKPSFALWVHPFRSVVEQLSPNPKVSSLIGGSPIPGQRILSRSVQSILLLEFSTTFKRMW